MRFGAHMSIQGGLSRAFDRAEETGCDSMQIFTKNTNAWAAKPLDESDVTEFRARAKASPVEPVVAHASYLINIASPDKQLRERSRTALRIELERCERLDIPYLVLHPGAHVGTGERSGLKRAAQSLNALHRWTRGYRSQVLLENTAGQGTTLCSELASLRVVLDAVKDPERLGVCIDTCHLFAAGYDLRTAGGYDAMTAELRECVGLDKVRCVHLNDSKRKLGSRVDRHENIGEGELGLKGFRRLVNDQRFNGLPMLLETPKEGDMDRVNLATVRRLARAGRGKARRG